MKHNITAAYAALNLWDEALVSITKHRQKDGVHGYSNILITALQLKASCLVRVGQDELALEVLDQALAEIEVLISNEMVNAKKCGIRITTLQRIHREKAHSLQRLLRYQCAKHEYLCCGTPASTTAAAICDLRLGDCTAAIETLRSHEADSNGEILLQNLLYLLNSKNRSKRGLEMVLQRSVVSHSPVYRWFLSLETGTPTSPCSLSDQILEYCEANVGAFDDPLLLQLDDKIFLHQLLSEHAEASDYWPCSFMISASELKEIMSRDASFDEAHKHCSTWIAKHRAGYGSHGNTLLRICSKRLNELGDKKDIIDCKFLLQKMVDAPYLLRRRKFSLRFYAVYFAISETKQSEVFVSKEGLVKIAALPLTEHACSKSADNARRHMTNTGRDGSMQQESFDYLRRNLPSESFETVLWPRVLKVVRDVINALDNHARLQELRFSEHDNDSDLGIYRRRLGEIGLPKILGFDFVIDTSLKVWLIEVNRFPGLEPRDNVLDASVKRQIIRDAWSVAARRHEKNLILESILRDFALWDCRSNDNALEQIQLYS